MIILRTSLLAIVPPNVRTYNSITFHYCISSAYLIILDIVLICVIVNFSKIMLLFHTFCIFKYREPIKKKYNVQFTREWDLYNFIQKKKIIPSRFSTTDAAAALVIIFSEVKLTLITPELAGQARPFIWIRFSLEFVLIDRQSSVKLRICIWFKSAVDAILKGLWNKEPSYIASWHFLPYSHHLRNN